MMEGATYIANNKMLERLRDNGVLDHFEFRVRDNVFSWWCDTPECKAKNRPADESRQKETVNRALEEKPENILPLYGIGPKHFNSTLDTFTGYPKVISAARDYLQKQNENLLITGSCGSGKTHIAIAMLREMIRGGKRNLMFRSVPELMLELRNSFDDMSDMNEEEIIGEHTMYHCLVLDDLGAEKFSEYAVQCLYLIIDRRLNLGKRTIITTNLSVEEINETVSPRIASRLSEYRVFKFTMDDYRTKR